MTVSEIKKIINPKIRSVPSDDFRIIDSWTEYEQESKKPLNERKLEYLCYQIEVVNPQTGDKTKAFKALTPKCGNTAAWLALPIKVYFL